MPQYYYCKSRLTGNKRAGLLWENGGGCSAWVGREEFCKDKSGTRIGDYSAHERKIIQEIRSTKLGIHS